MTLVILGCVGVGAVWGWLIGKLDGTSPSPVRKVLAVGLATLLLAIEIFILAEWRALAFFLGAAALALLIHLGWRRELIARFGRSDPKGGPL